MCKTRRSYGIICIRKSREIELLMIKKAISYSYSAFINGNYTANNTPYMLKLFGGMSHSEKTLVLSMNFESMWQLMYHENPVDYTDLDWRPFYEKKMNKFKRSFTFDRLRFLIENSTTKETPWEFPRGRPQDYENPKITAIREFQEETGVNNQYQVLWHVKPFVHSYVDSGVRYIIKYYFAVAGERCVPSYSFASKHQRSEVSAIGWMSLNSIRNHIGEDHIFRQYEKMFKSAERNYETPRILYDVSY